MNLWQTVHDHFSSATELKHYATRVSEGLRIWEQTILRDYHSNSGLLLNIGCGSGREALALHQRGYSVVGLDISLPELKNARKIVPNAIPLLCTDGLRLPFTDNTFQQIALWSQTFGNVPYARNRKYLLSECHRVLMPGGTLSFSVHDLYSCEPVARDKGWVIEAHAPQSGDFLLREDNLADTSCYWHYFTRPEIMDLCKHADLTPQICELDSHFGQNWNRLWICAAKK